MLICSSLKENVSDIFANCKKILSQSKAYKGSKDYDVIQIICNVLDMHRDDFVFSLKTNVCLSKKKKIIKMIQFLVDGRPLGYILPTYSFYGIEFFCKKCLIPRPETEIMVEKTIKLISLKQELKKSKTLKILDLCCGSGCIGISILKNTKDTECDFIDKSKNAIFATQKNIAFYNLEQRSNVFNLDIKNQNQTLEKIISKKYDFIVCNPPYVPKKDIKELDIQVLHEPKMALDGGANGTEMPITAIQFGCDYLLKDGHFIIEIGHNQFDKIRESVEQIICSGGFFASYIPDYSKIKRFVYIQPEVNLN